MDYGGVIMVAETEDLDGSVPMTRGKPCTIISTSFLSSSQ